MMPNVGNYEKRTQLKIVDNEKLKESLEKERKNSKEKGNDSRLSSDVKVRNIRN